ncbi:MAG: cation diffusion facilitator family transporter [Eubacteriales bacterium]|nr:cation diffusion facilitator family transporter [Eubacteriales bacterium]
MKQKSQTDSRSRQIVRASIIGIITNVFLSVFKAVIGTLTNSIAITLDAVNNLSDAASSVITIVGTRLAGKEPDKKHPFGYGRIEYLSAMAISFLVLYAGITSLTESVKKILHPETPEYSSVALIIVAVGVVTKIVLGRYVKSVGVKTDSDALVNSGEDATLDSVISASTLLAAGIYLFSGISLESWLGAVISVIIIKSGAEMLFETISRILGERVDADLAKEIKKTVLEFQDVQGVYDLVLADFGPNEYRGSLHIEVPDTYTADELDELIRSIQMTVYGKHHILLTAIGVYSINTKDAHAVEVRETLRKMVMSHPHIRQMHGFYLNEKKKSIRFDVIVSFDAEDRTAVYRHIIKEAEELYPDYTFNVALDTDFMES